MVFQDRVFLCSSGCTGTHAVNQAGLKIRRFPCLFLFPCTGSKGTSCLAPSQGILKKIGDSLHIYYDSQFCVFYGIPVCTNVCISMSICDSCFILFQFYFIIILEVPLSFLRTERWWIPIEGDVGGSRGSQRGEPSS